MKPLPTARAGRRRARAGAITALIALLLVALTACGSAGSQSAEPESNSADVNAVEHKFGETKVPADASRVVTVGWNDQDFVLALGVVPVTTRSWFDNYNDFPWVKEATGGKGVPAMEGDEIDFEQIAAAKPDVIFAIYETIDRKTYDRLSQIAPTVIQSDDYADEETPWNVQLLTTGEALGKRDLAEALVEEVQGKIEAAKQANPKFAESTLVEDFGPENGGHYLIGAGDPRRTLFDALGFTSQSTVGDVSEEKLSTLDEDVLFVVGATPDQMAASPAFSRLKVVQEGRTLYTTFESNLGGALSYSGPNALLYALDVLAPQLANAVNGQPVADLSNA